ncbi:hypothetical protein ACHAWF_003387 [Thalassiosira exigua]
MRNIVPLHPAPPISARQSQPVLADRIVAAATMSASKPRRPPSDKGDHRAMLAAVSKANATVSSSLRRSIRNHVQNEDYDAGKDGLDFLHVKNGLMISYLIDLTMLLRFRLKHASNHRRERANDDDDEEEEEDDGSSSDGGSAGEDRQQQRQCLERLLEMKTALEKMRPLEKRMRYQIDKLLALSTLGAGTFAAVGREEEEGDDEEESGPAGDRGDDDDGKDDEHQSASDPLSFKPDLQGMMKMFEGDENEQTNGNESDSDGEDGSNIVGGASKSKIALEKDDEVGPSGGVYQPPRLQSVPFELDNERIVARERRRLEKERERLSRSELAAVVRSQLTDAPDVEDVRGGAMLGTQSEKSRKIAARDADIQEFEESQMIRLTMGKEEKRARKKMMREEMSNLGAISGGLGNVVAGVNDAFGDDTGRSESDDDRFKTKGMRKRKVEIFHEQSRPLHTKKKKKKKGGSNVYQKTLYG